jgi:hypothetical protein
MPVDAAAMKIVVLLSAMALLIAAPTAGAAVIPSPQTTLGSGPDALGNDATPTFTFSSDRDTSSFECRFAQSAGEAWSTTGKFPCGDGQSFESVQWTSGALSDGTRHFQVRACALVEADSEIVEKCDNSPAKRTFAIDTVAPPVDQWSVGPDGPRVRDQVWVGFGSSEAGAAFRCWIDAAEPAPCSADLYSGELADGPHSMSVQAGDAAGNWSTPRTHAWIRDRTSPRLTLGGPSDTQDTTPTWTWDAAPDDGKSPPMWIQDCAGTSWTSGGPLADGVYELTVVVHDEAGNHSQPKTFAVRVDTTPPAIDAIAWQAEQKRIVITAEDVALECRFDALDPWACGFTVDGSALTAGPHTFTARAIDLAGNEATKTIAFTVAGDPGDPGDPGNPGNPGNPGDPGNPAPGGGGPGGGFSEGAGGAPGTPHLSPFIPPVLGPVGPAGDAPRSGAPGRPVGGPARPAKAKPKKRCATKRKLAKGKRAGSAAAKRAARTCRKASARKRAAKRVAKRA